MSHSEEKSTGIGVIGAGFHARVNVLPALVLAEVPVVGIAARSLPSAGRAARVLGGDVATHDSAATLLADAAVGGVVIVAQPGDQVHIVEEAIRAGSHVLVEKPLGLTTEQSRQVALLADHHGVTVSVGFMKRFAPVYLRLKSALDEGALGRVQSFSLTFGCDSSSFAATAREHLLFAAIHVIDLTRWLFGEASTVTTTLHRDGRSLSLSVAISFGSGVVGTLDLVSAPSRQSEVEALTVTGDEGWAETRGARELVIHRFSDEGGVFTDATTSSTRFAPAESTMSGGAADLHQRGFVGEMAHFAAVVRQEQEPRSSAWDNVRTMELCDLILDSVIHPTSPIEWALGEPGPIRDGLLERILIGSKSGSTSLAVSYEMRGEKVPVVGDRRSLPDSSGRTAAVIEFTEVWTGPLSGAPRHMRVRDGGDEERFERSHLDYFETLVPSVRDFLGDQGWALTADTQAVSTAFRVVHARE